ncbi:MAG: GAF domain-containing sensor histidine kinase, partial [Polyangiales bacterium]
ATARAGTRDELALAILPEAARAVGGRTAYVVLSDEAGDLSLLHIGTDAAEAAPPDSLAPPSRGSRPSIPTAAPISGNEGRPSGVGSPIFNLDGPSIRRLRIKAGEGIMGQAISTGQTVVVPDASADRRLSPRTAQALFPGKEHVGAPCAVVPLLDEHENAFGALAVLKRPGDKPFVDDDVDVLRLVALNASTGFQLQRARDTHGREARLSTIGSLLSGMLHDLKTPMTVISGYVQLMVNADDRASRNEYAEYVLRQFDQIAAMQREVLDFARGERTVLIRRVYVAKFFDDFAKQLQHEVERRKTPIELVLDLKDRGTARFDEPKVTRALHNLTRNAVEAMGSRGGRLTIGVDRDAGALVISVSDTGPGILPEVQERLFESFVTAGKETGTGLGLAIVKKIAEDHGGTIEASSSLSGAKFVLRLPQPQEALRRTPTAPPAR